MENNFHEDSPVIKLVNFIMLQAIISGASDVHFEPYDNYYNIRLRIDGVLQIMEIQRDILATRICARLKVMANLDLSERRRPQDGRFSFYSNNISVPVDCRISICPTLHGEKVVVRFLNSLAAMNPDINNLPLSLRDKSCLLEVLSSTQGLILVTGPTGSGKSMTMYSALNYLNTNAVNIMTVEDPVELKLPMIHQVQVNNQIGLSFAKILRSLLRQDPDVIMIGEIRDLETAEIVVKASQTGHLVLTTLHTNSAAQTIMRLINIGIPAFNIIDAVKLIIAQRLLRKLCEKCKMPYSKKELELLILSEQLTGNFYKANGCCECNQGYKGRIAIFEVMPISAEIAKITLLSNITAQNIVLQAKSEGMNTLREAGLQKAALGLVSMDEVNRVT